MSQFRQAFSLGQVVRQAWDRGAACLLKPATHLRALSTSSPNFVKEIRETVADNITTIEGVHVPHFSEQNVLKLENKNGCCVLCNLNLDVKYTDVLILNQFLRPGRGTVLPRRVTGLCGKQQRVIDLAYYQAGKAGLLKKIFTESKGTRWIMTKKKGFHLPRYYDRPYHF